MSGRFCSFNEEIVGERPNDATAEGVINSKEQSLDNYYEILFRKRRAFQCGPAIKINIQYIVGANINTALTGHGGVARAEAITTTQLTNPLS